MISRMRGNDNGDLAVLLNDPLVWVIGGTATAVLLYQIFKSGRPADQIAPVAPKEAPTAFVDLNAVATRFGQVRELWTMGYLSPEETLDQLTGLLDATGNLVQARKASAADALEITTRIEQLMRDVAEFQQLQAGVPA